MMAFDGERDPCTEAILAATFDVANGLGAGFRESVYERALLFELQLRGVTAKQQVHYAVKYKGKHVGHYLADLAVEDKVVVELKCVESLAPPHTASALAICGPPG